MKNNTKDIENLEVSLANLLDVTEETFDETADDAMARPTQPNPYMPRPGC